MKRRTKEQKRANAELIAQVPSIVDDAFAVLAGRSIENSDDSHLRAVAMVAQMLRSVISQIPRELPMKEKKAMFHRKLWEMPEDAP